MRVKRHTVSSSRALACGTSAVCQERPDARHRASHQNQRPYPYALAQGVSSGTQLDKIH